MTLYTLSAIDSLINRYVKRGGQVTTIKEGVLGYGVTMLSGDGLKTTIITERYLNDSSSAHSIRMYNKIPAKYAQLV